MGRQIKDAQLNMLVYENCLNEVLFFDETGTIFAANAAARNDFGYGKRLIGHSVADIFPQVFLNEEEVFSLSGTNEGTVIPTTAYQENGLCFPVSLKIVRSDNTGICISEDRTLQEEAVKREQLAQEKIAQADRLRNEFLANITHELRTPVNGIRGLAQEVEKNVEKKQARDDIAVILHCCDNMSALINRLLDFSKMEAGEVELWEEEFSFAELMKKVLAVYRPQIQEKGLQFVVNIASDLPDKMIGDSARLEQIYLNFLSNAVKFTSEGYIGLEVLATSRENGKIELFSRVIDTGIGISKDKLDSVLLSFRQADSSITRKYGGTGLGLSINKKLVEQMEGNIRIESTPGEGSIFSFTVRLGVKEEAPVLKKWNKANIRQFFELIERFSFSVQLENMIKAEEVAEQIKDILPEGEKELYRSVLRVQMELRKGHTDAAMEEVAELRTKLNSYDFGIMFRGNKGE